MKIQDIDRVNHLIAELSGIKELITHAERAEPGDFEMFIKLPGDASIRLSSEGAASAHYSGFSASPEFLGRLQHLAMNELERQAPRHDRGQLRWRGAIHDGQGAAMKWFDAPDDIASEWSRALVLCIRTPTWIQNAPPWLWSICRMHSWMRRSGTLSVRWRARSCPT